MSKHMYGVVSNGQVIGIHNEMSAAESFSSTYNSEQGYDASSVIKIPKKNVRKVAPCYDEIYLVRAGDTYIPSKLFSVYKKMTSETVNEYRLAIDILYRVVETEDVSSRDMKSIEKVVCLLENFISEFEGDDALPSISLLSEMSDNYSSYEDAIGIK